MRPTAHSGPELHRTYSLQETLVVTTGLTVAFVVILLALSYPALVGAIGLGVVVGRVVPAGQTATRRAHGLEGRAGETASAGTDVRGVSEVE